MSARHLVVVPLAALLVLPACEGSDPTTSASPTGPTSTTSSPAGTGAPGEPDPLVPFSPAPTEVGERTAGWLGETLLVRTPDGSLWVSVDSTAMTPFAANGSRMLSVWITVHNPGDAAWTGAPGTDALLTDEAGNTFLPISDPSTDELHPTPEAYGASNRNLAGSVTVEAGASLQGVIVFRPTGGNRPVVFSMSLDGEGRTEWQTNLGPF